MTILRAAEVFGLDYQEKELLANRAGLSVKYQGDFNTDFCRKLLSRYGSWKHFIAKSNLTERMFWYIHSGVHPSKGTLVAIAVAAEIELQDVQEMLNRAGYSLSHSIPEDLIVYYFLGHRRELNRDISLVWQINTVLDELELPLLGTRFYHTSGELRTSLVGRNL